MCKYSCHHVLAMNADLTSRKPPLDPSLPPSTRIGRLDFRSVCRRRADFVQTPEND